MKIPKSKKSFKKCDDFAICSFWCEPGFVGVEHPLERTSIYQYVVYGSARMGTVFNEEYMCLTEKNFYSIKKYDDYTIMKADDELFWIGFNVLDKSHQWDGRIVSENKLIVNKKSYLICFDGFPMVNDKIFERYSYASLEPNRTYKIDISNGVLGLFTQIN